jgi:hypothetical protein
VKAMMYLLVWLLLLLLVALGVVGSIIVALPGYRRRMRRLERHDPDLQSVLFEGSSWDLW